MRSASSRLPITLAVLGFAALALTAVATGSRPQHPAAENAPAAASASSPATPAAPVAVAHPASAAEPRADVPDASRDTEAVGSAGMRVFLDTETGQLGPAPARPVPLRAELESAALSRSSEGLREVVLPDGSVMVDLQGRFQEYVVVEIGPDGTRRMRCVQQPQTSESQTEELR